MDGRAGVHGEQAEQAAHPRLGAVEHDPAAVDVEDEPAERADPDRRRVAGMAVRTGLAGVPFAPFMPFTSPFGRAWPLTANTGVPTADGSAAITPTTSATEGAASCGVRGTISPVSRRTASASSAYSAPRASSTSASAA